MSLGSTKVFVLEELREKKLIDVSCAYLRLMYLKIYKYRIIISTFNFVTVISLPWRIYL